MKSFFKSKWSFAIWCRMWFNPEVFWSIVWVLNAVFCCGTMTNREWLLWVVYPKYCYKKGKSGCCRVNTQSTVSDFRRNIPPVDVIRRTSIHKADKEKTLMECGKYSDIIFAPDGVVQESWIFDSLWSIECRVLDCLVCVNPCKQSSF